MGSGCEWETCRDVWDAVLGVWLTLVDSGGEKRDEDVGEFVHFRTVLLFGRCSFFVTHPGFEAEIAGPDFLVIETY